MAKKILIAYYSRRGENYVNGSIRHLSLGNTEVVAAKIKDLLPEADMFRIDTVKKYSDSYMTCIEEAKQELHDQARPEMKDKPESIADYDVIILGYPNWWSTQDHHPLLYQRGQRHGVVGTLYPQTVPHGDGPSRCTHSWCRGSACRP